MAQIKRRTSCAEPDPEPLDPDRLAPGRRRKAGRGPGREKADSLLDKASPFRNGQIANLTAADNIRCPVCDLASQTPSIAHDVQQLTVSRDAHQLADLAGVGLVRAQAHIFHSLLPRKKLDAQEETVFDDFGFTALEEAQDFLRMAIAEYARTTEAARTPAELDLKGASAVSDSMRRLSELAFTVSGRLKTRPQTVIQNAVALGNPMHAGPGRPLLPGMPGIAALDLEEFQEARRLIHQRHGQDIVDETTARTLELGQISYRAQKRQAEKQAAAAREHAEAEIVE